MLVTLILGILNWLCLLGYGLMVIRLLGIPTDNLTGPQQPLAVLLGILPLMWVCNLVSIFCPLGQVSLVLLAPGWFIGIWHLLGRARQSKFSFSPSAIKAFPLWLVIGCGLLFVTVWVKASAMSLAYDYGGYYLQTIRWVQEYGLVPGLANVASRFGFNSSWHVMQAALGYQYIPFLAGHGTYDLNELALLAFGLLALGQVRRGIAAGFQISSLFLGLCLLPIFWIFPGFLTSPAPDLGVMVFYWLTIWAGLQWSVAFLNRNLTHQKTWLALVWVLAASVLSIKLSGVVLMVLPVMLTLLTWYRSGIAIMWRPQGIKWWLGPLLGLVVLGTWCYRTATITGYVLYPVPGLPALAVDYALKPDLITVEVADVELFAKFGPRNPYLANSLGNAHKFTYSGWMPTWWQKEVLGYEKLFLIIVVLSLLMLPWLLVSLYRKQKLPAATALYLAAATITLILNFGLWFIKGPAMRFGFSFMIPAIILNVLLLVQRPDGSFGLDIVPRQLLKLSPWLWTLSLLLFLYNGRDLRVVRTPILPPTFPEVHFGSYQLAGSNITVQYPRSYLDDGTETPIVGPREYCELCAQCWNAPLPCISKRDTTLVLRGATLASGFRKLK